MRQHREPTRTGITMHSLSLSTLRQWQKDSFGLNNGFPSFAANGTTAQFFWSSAGAPSEVRAKMARMSQRGSEEDVQCFANIELLAAEIATARGRRFPQGGTLCCPASRAKAARGVMHRMCGCAMHARRLTSEWEVAASGHHQGPVSTRVVLREHVEPLLLEGKTLSRVRV